MTEQRSKRIIFKCLFGGKNGWGHVVRCSALADEFLERGWETLLCSEGPASKLPIEVSKAFARVSQEIPESGDVFFIDEMYTSQATFEQWIDDWKRRNPMGLVAGIDDMQRRSMAGFDVVVNSELGLNKASYLATHSLLSERFALLRRGFSEVDRKDSESIENTDFVPVLVMIGGTDAYGVMDTVLSALYESKIRFLPIVIVGEKALDCPVIERFEESRVLRNLNSSELAAWLRTARFGIIGCGTSVYELATMNVPFVGISLVDNQEATARMVEANWGLPIVHCEGGRLEKTEVKEAVESLLRGGMASYSTVDTKGASRVCDFILKLESR